MKKTRKGFPYRRSRFWGLVSSFCDNEQGELVGSIGWMAILATALVLIHGLISGWLPGFIGRIFNRMDLLVFCVRIYCG